MKKVFILAAFVATFAACTSTTTSESEVPVTTTTDSEVTSTVDTPSAVDSIAVTVTTK